jgi:hypothetical protein
MYLEFRHLILFIYWGTAVTLLVLALTLPKKGRRRVGWAALVITLFGYYPVTNEYKALQYKRYKEAAASHFRKRCADDAGERITQVFQNVEGIFLEKPRVQAKESSLRDQYWMGDPYGYSLYEALDPAGAYLYDRSGKTASGERFTPIKGFSFVEMPNPDYSAENGQAKYLRYTLQARMVRDGDRMVQRLIPVAQHVSSLKSRFAMTWDDISTPEDRKFWVAGGSLSIRDMHTNEIVARRVGYVIDPYLGDGGGDRSIWLHVNRTRDAFCPTFELDLHKNKEFVSKVLQPTRGAANGN